MFGFQLLLLLLQASCIGYKLPLEPFLIQRVLRDDEILSSEADLLFGEREVVVVQGVIEVLRVVLILVPLRVIELLLEGNVVARSSILSGVSFSPVPVLLSLPLRPLDRLRCRRCLGGPSPGLSPSFLGVPLPFFPLVPSHLSLVCPPCVFYVEVAVHFLVLGVVGEYVV